MTDRIDAVVVGAGVVGLAIARALSQQGREVVVVERNARIGEETSARNSEVIHGGLYYPTNSLKARLCVRGREQLYAYCVAKGVPHARCGKLIVAVGPGQLDALETLRRQALANGVGDIERLTAADVARFEPAIECAAGLRSPSTGIIDSHTLMLTLRADTEAAGGAIAVLSRFTRASAGRGRLTIQVEAEGNETELEAGIVVNSAGLAASEVARSIEGLDISHVPTTRYAKGNYFMLQGSSPFKQLIYPLPEPGGLGVHVTLDLAGRARFGPDVEWVEEIDYRVDPSRGEAFYAAIRSYWPELSDDSLVAGYAGIRPKIVERGAPAGDFRISGPAEHGVDGLVNLFGIESPGLTASLAIADHVVELLGIG
jgi:L-2-hydroxyglutarate oxidase LhgO